jgi:hypothetical protein
MSIYRWFPACKVPATAIINPTLATLQQSIKLRFSMLTCPFNIQTINLTIPPLTTQIVNTWISRIKPTINIVITSLTLSRRTEHRTKSIKAIKPKDSILHLITKINRLVHLFKGNLVLHKNLFRRIKIV